VPLRLIAIAAATLLVVPALAAAAPGIVQAREASARNAPRPDAPVLHVFPAGAAVSVSEVVEDGFRRIRLPDGRVGFVEDGIVAIAEAPAPAQAPLTVAASASVAGPDLAPRMYVKDLDHLSRLVQADPVIRAQARRLERRRRAAVATGVVGFGASLALTAAGFVRMNNAFDQTSASPAADAPKNDGMGLVITGLAVCALTPVVMWAVLPKHGDVLDVVDGWNARHPAEPFELGQADGHRSQSY
jgi:hypothetical protein